MRYQVGGIAALLAFAPGCTHRTPPVTPPLPPHYTVLDLGMLGGENSWADSLNNRGQIVGRLGRRMEEAQPFLWSGGKITHIAPASGRMACAAQINDSGQVVGTLDLHRVAAGGGDTSAFL